MIEEVTERQIDVLRGELDEKRHNKVVRFLKSL